MNRDEVRETINRRQQNVETSNPSPEIPKVVIHPGILETVHRRMRNVEKELEGNRNPIVISAKPISETNRLQQIRERALSLKNKKDEFKKEQARLKLQREEQIFQEKMRAVHEKHLIRLAAVQEKQEGELKEVGESVDNFIQENQRQIHACQESVELFFAQYSSKELAINRKLESLLESGEKNIEQLLEEVICQHEEELRQALLKPTNKSTDDPEKKIASLRQRDEERRMALQARIDEFRFEVEAAGHQTTEELKKFFMQPTEEIGVRIESLSFQEKERAQMRKEQMKEFAQKLEEVQKVNVEQNRQKIEKLRKDLCEGIQDHMQKFEAMDADDQSTYRFHQYQIGQLNSQVSVTERMIREIEQQKLKIAEKIVEVKEANAKLTVAIKKTEKAIKKRDNNRLNDALKVAASVAICCCATWGLEQLLPNATPIVSTIKNGAEVTFKFTG